MDEKRKAKRLVLDANLVMNRIDSGKHDLIPVEIVDLSTNGIGFKCDQVLEINSVYEAELTIWTKEVIHAFVNLVRLDNSGDDNIYGATFVGMTEQDSNKIAIYDMFDEAKKAGLI
ncbi:MAG: PilZ domain-containing protein [Lachnospiraceae bacterium]|nr:PilZ domain-containing protein [Lachnospiraceae bacterium]